MERYRSCPPYLVWRACEVCQAEVENCDEVAVEFDGEQLPDGYRDYSRVRHWTCHAFVRQAEIAMIRQVSLTGLSSPVVAVEWRERELSQPAKAA